MSIDLEKYFRSWNSFIGKCLPVFSERLSRAQREGQGSASSSLGSVVFFASWVVATVSITLVATSPLVTDFGALGPWTLQVYLAAIFIVWLSAALALPHWTIGLFWNWTLLVAAAGCPVAVMVIQTCAGFVPRYSFWLVLTFWTAVAVGGVWETRTGWQRFILVAGTVWSVSGVIASAGLTRFLPYSRSALAEIEGIHQLLDVRLVVGVVFGVCIVATSFTRAWKRGIPPIRDIPLKEIPLPKETDAAWVRYLLGPFLVVAEISLELLHAICNLAWIAVAATGIFFARVGEEIALLFKAIVKDRRSMSWLSTCLVTFFALAALFSLGFAAARVLVSYLLSGDGLVAEFRDFALLSVYCLGALSLVATLAWLVRERREEAIRGAVQGLMFMLAIAFVSGLAVMVVARYELLELPSFGTPGPFSILLSFLVLSGILFWLGQHKRAARD